MNSQKTYYSNCRNYLIFLFKQILMNGLLMLVLFGFSLSHTYAGKTDWMNASSAKSFLRKIRRENSYPTKVTCRENTRKKTEIVEMRFTFEKNDKNKKWSFLSNSRNTSRAVWRRIYDTKGMDIISFSQFKRASSGMHYKCIIGVVR